MPRLDLRLLPQTTTLRALDTLEGTVEVRADQDVRCQGLRLTLGWTASGSGNTHEAPVQTELLYEGEWRGGATTAYPFQIPLPNGPVSFEGTHVRVRWWLEAHADLPWAIDARARTDLQLLPAPAGATAAYDFGPDFTDPALAPKGSDTTIVVMGLLAVVVGGTFAAAGFTLFVGTARLLGLLGLVVAGVLTWTLTIPAIQNLRAARVLGPVLIEPEPAIAPRGAPLAVTVRLSPPGPVTITGGHITLTGVERAVSRSRDNKQTVYERDLFEAQAALAPTDDPHVLRAQLTVPADAPPTFDAPWNHVVWRVQAEVQAAGAPTWRGKAVIAVGG